jgi:hypothetical protein
VWVPHDVRDLVVDFARCWSEKTKIGTGRFIHWLGVRASKFYDWRGRYGRVNEHNGWIPRDFWLQPWEKQAIIGFHQEHPLEGYRRLTFMMLDADVVAASPSSVWRASETSRCYGLASTSFTTRKRESACLAQTVKRRIEWGRSCPLLFNPQFKRFKLLLRHALQSHRCGQIQSGNLFYFVAAFYVATEFLHFWVSAHFQKHFIRIGKGQVLFNQAVLNQNAIIRRYCQRRWMGLRSALALFWVFHCTYADRFFQSGHFLRLSQNCLPVGSMLDQTR